MPTAIKKKIKTAFIDILEEKPLSKITVKDIVNTCRVNRNSFYYYYPDIPTLLDEVIKDEADMLMGSLPQPFLLEDSVTVIMNRMEEKKRIVYHIWHSANREHYEAHLMQICEYASEKYVRSLAPEYGLTAEEQYLFTDYLKCEFIGQILQWIHRDMSYSIVSHATVMCETFRLLARKITGRKDSGKEVPAE